MQAFSDEDFLLYTRFRGEQFADGRLAASHESISTITHPSVFMLSFMGTAI